MEAALNTGNIEKKVLIQASPEIVFRALVEARHLVQWFCDRVTSDPRVGGELKAYWRSGRAGGRAVFTRIEPGSMVELRWIDDGGTHVICYTIRRKRNTSEVTMRDEGNPPPDDETFAVLNQGWINVLRDLKDYCESKERSSKRRAGRSAQAQE